MTPLEMNAAIAEHLGWKNVHVYEDDAGPPIHCGTPPGPISYDAVIPRYSEDLNAMREALAQLPEELEEEFMHFLCSIHGANPSEPLFTCFDVLTCKPQVYAKAFLQTVGKWRKE